MATVTETPEEALARIQRMGWCKNDALAIMAFCDCGIPPEEITPRANVLTFNAWKGAGRQVAKGARAVRVTVWIPKSGGKDEEPQEGEKKKRKGGMYPKTTSLFHVSQTIPKGAPKGTKPEAWANPLLVRAGTYEDDPAPVAHVSGEIADAFGMRDLPNTVVHDDGPRLTIRYGSTVIHEDKPAPVVPPELPQDFDPRPTADFGAMGDDKPATCSCPMVGVITNVDCPIHGDEARRLAR